MKKIKKFIFDTKIQNNVLDKMGYDLLLEELKYINNMVIHNDKMMLSLMIALFTINFFFIKSDIGTLIGLFILILVKYFFMKDLTIYKKDLLKRLIDITNHRSQ